MNIRIRACKIAAIITAYIPMHFVLTTVRIFTPSSLDTSEYVGIGIITFMVAGGAFLIPIWLYRKASIKEKSFKELIKENSIGNAKNLKDSDFLEYCEYVIRKTIKKGTVDARDEYLQYLESELKSRKMVERKGLLCENKLYDVWGVDFLHRDGVKASSKIVFFDKFTPLGDNDVVPVSNIEYFVVKKRAFYSILEIRIRKKSFAETVQIHTLHIDKWVRILSEAKLENKITTD